MKSFLLMSAFFDDIIKHILHEPVQTGSHRVWEQETFFKIYAKVVYMESDKVWALYFLWFLCNLEKFGRKGNFVSAHSEYNA